MVPSFILLVEGRVLGIFRRGSNIRGNAFTSAIWEFLAPNRKFRCDLAVRMHAAPLGRFGELTDKLGPEKLYLDRRNSGAAQ